jgi:hypothetical protein
MGEDKYLLERTSIFGRGQVSLVYLFIVKTVCMSRLCVNVNMSHYDQIYMGGLCVFPLCMHLFYFFVIMRMDVKS